MFKVVVYTSKKSEIKILSLTILLRYFTFVNLITICQSSNTKYSYRQSFCIKILCEFHILRFFHRSSCINLGLHLKIYQDKSLTIYEQ